MSSNLRWVSLQALIMLHDESLREHGGDSGIRDVGLLQSSLARPLTLVAYGEPDIADLAACYCTGIVQNHPFVDGNKRAGFLAHGLFLGLNGTRLVTTNLDATETILRLAAGVLAEPELAAWIRERMADGR